MSGMWKSQKPENFFFFSVILSPTVFLFGQHLQFLGSSALSLTVSNLPIFTSFPQLRPSLKTTVHHFNLSLDNLFNSLAPRSFPLTYLAKPQLWINLSTFSAPLFELLSTAIKKKISHDHADNLMIFILTRVFNTQLDPFGFLVSSLSRSPIAILKILHSLQPLVPAPHPAPCVQEWIRALLMSSHNIPVNTAVALMTLLLSAYLNPCILLGFKHIENEKHNLLISETSELNIVLSIQYVFLEWVNH